MSSYNSKYDYFKNGLPGTSFTCTPHTLKSSGVFDKDQKLWNDIRRAALSNPALQDALDRAKIIYYLSKENGNN